MRLPVGQYYLGTLALSQMDARHENVVSGMRPRGSILVRSSTWIGSPYYWTEYSLNAAQASPWSAQRPGPWRHWLSSALGRAHHVASDTDMFRRLTIRILYLAQSSWYTTCSSAIQSIPAATSSMNRNEGTETVRNQQGVKICEGYVASERAKDR